MELSIESRCIHLEEDDRAARYGAISFPIYQTATFAHPGLGESTGYDYSRLQNPTREHLEKVVAALEKGEDAVAFSSGLAAIAAAIELFKSGDHIIAEADLYGGSTRLFNMISEKHGISFTFVDCKEDIEEYFRPETRAVFIETPTNPMMNIIDIEKVAKAAHAHGALLIVDNTFLSPYFQNPLELGADIVVHSGTKYLSGHNDTLAGFVISKDKSVCEEIRNAFKIIGSSLAPFDSWLILRGIKTLAVRMERAAQNAERIASFLKENPHVTRVLYPGLPEHQGYEIMKKQSRGFGAMLTFDIDSPERVEGILKNLKVIQYAESLGGTESLITYPILQTHADVPTDMLSECGVSRTTLRMSVGIENVDDLINDLEAVLA